MKWQKMGLVFRPESRYNWMVSHASLPIAVHLGEDIYRIYFSSRDKLNRSHVGYIEIDINEPDKILYLTPEPVLAPGPLGYFDDHGVMASSIVTYDNKMYLYYIGWNPGRGKLNYNSIGLVLSEDEGKTFHKPFKAPVLARSEYDPCFVASPLVMIEGNIWRLWYSSGIKCEIKNKQFKSYYHMKYAESADGVNWERKGIVCIDFKDKAETNIARPCIIKEDGLYKMWYPCNRGQGYRIGYAESEDGIKWQRKDEEVGIDVSESGWDSEMIVYPWVFVHKGRKYMLYNGNRFGKEGLGLAVEA